MPDRKKQTALLALVAVVILAVAVRLLWPDLWGPPRSDGSGSGAGDRVAAAPENTPAPGPAAAEPTGGEVVAPREKVVPKTVVRGTFRAPVGAWPGGGRAELRPMPEPIEGGLMGLLGAGMQQARRAPNAPAGSSDLKRSIKAMLGQTEPLVTAEVDAFGAFTFEDPPPGRCALRLRHPNLQNAAPVEFEIAAGSTQDLGVIDTRLAARLLVLVSDPSGRPVENASVQIGRQVDMSKFMDPSQLGDVAKLIGMFAPLDQRTDERGACQYDGIEGDVSWNLHVASSGFVEHHGVVPIALGRDNIVRVQLSKGGALRVAVVDPDGAPRAGARLRVVFPGIVKPGRLGAGNDEPVEHELTTGEDGTVEQAGLPLGLARVELRTPGYLRAEQEVVIGADEVPAVSFRLDPGVAVAGRVVGEDGEPLGKAHVMHMALLGQKFMGTDLSSMMGLDMLSMGIDKRGVPCDAEGRFVLGGFKAGEVANLLAAAPGFDAGRAEEVEAGRQDVEIRLLRSARLAGRVVSARDHEPVPAFDISLTQRAFFVFDRPVVTESFEGRADGSFSIEPVPRETFELVVKADGHAPWSKQVDLRAGSADVGDIELELPAAIEGITVDPEGIPLAGVSVRVAKGGMADMMMMMKLLGGKAVVSDEEGHFRIEDLGGHGVRLLADKEGYAPFRSKVIRVQPGEITGDQVLQLTAGGSIRGKLVDANGKGISGWRIQAAHASGRSVQVTETDAAGEFFLEGLEAGTHKVDALPGDYMQRFAAPPRDVEDGKFDLSKLIGDAMQWSASDRVVVRDGEESEVTLVFEAPEGDRYSVTVEGGVRVGGADMEHGVVLLVPAGSAVPRHVATVADGAFRIAGVRPGPYTLRVQADLLTGFVGTPRHVRIPADEHYRLDVELPGGRLSGVVVHDTGEPASGIVLSLLRPGASAAWTERFDLGEGTVLTDASGTFRFDGLAEGSYEILAKEMALEAGAVRSGRLSHLTLAPGEVRDDLVLHVGRGSVIRVAVRDGLGPRGNALVTLLDPRGMPLDLFHRELTDAEGAATFQGVPAGSYRVSVDAPAAAPEVSEIVHVALGDERDLEILLPRGIEVRLQIEGELPSEARGELLQYSVWRSDGALLRVGRVVVPVEAAASREIEFGFFEPGEYTLRAESPSAGLIEVRRRVPEHGAVSWKLDLSTR